MPLTFLPYIAKLLLNKESPTVLALILLIDKISAWIGKAFAWCILIMTFGIGYEVFVRYLPRIFRSLGIDSAPLIRDVIGYMAPTPWAFDLSYMMYGALFMMAGAYTLSRDGHVRADLFYRKMRPRRQAALELTLYILFFFPGILAFMITGYDYAHDSLGYREVSINSPANVPIFQFKYIIPLAGTLLFVQGIAQVCRCLLCLRHGQWPGLLADVEETDTILIHAKDEAAETAAAAGR